jgi:hypothetical protein
MPGANSPMLPPELLILSLCSTTMWPIYDPPEDQSVHSGFQELGNYDNSDNKSGIDSDGSSEVSYVGGPRVQKS